MTQAAILAASGSPGTTTGFKNKLINGNMTIAQRGTSFSGLSDDGGQYTLDRWRWSENGTYTGSQTVTQDTSAPAGFINSLKVVTNTAITVGTSLSSRVEQFIEGLNCADLAWGTASAKTVTLSFWVRSSLTGTFGGAIRNSADDRSYPFSYTISVADTWTQASVTIPGDTSGTWLTTNGTGMRVTFSLGAGTALSGTANTWAAAGYQSVTGAVAVNATLNATFYITGCQLEVGTTATNFDFRSYGTELQLCQRYYQLFSRSEECIYGGSTTTSSGGAAIIFQQVMRAAPTITFATAGSSSGNISFLNASGNTPSTIGTHAAISITTYGTRMTFNGYTSAFSGGGVVSALYAYGGPITVYTASAEL